MEFWDAVWSQFGKREVVPELVRDNEKSFAPQNLNDTILTRASGGYVGTPFQYNNQSSITETGKIDAWRAMAQCPEIAWAVNEICNDAVILDYDTYPCELTMDDDSELPDALKEKLVKEFRAVMKILNFKRNGVELFRQWYIDGKVYYHGVLDPKNNKKGLIGIRWIDPRNIKRVVVLEDDKYETGYEFQNIKDDYYVYKNNHGYKTTYGYSQVYGTNPTAVEIRVNPECVAYANSGIFFENGDGTNFSLSNLDAALRPYNTLSALEQAMTIYRIARAPERRVFYVDVGNLQKDKADQYLANVMTRFKRKLIFNSATGTINTENNEMGVMDDFWLPRKEGGRGTEVTTLQSGSAWSDMNDLDWFMKKVLRGLNIPYGRFNTEGQLFSSGRSMEITREEVKFAKFISQLRAKYAQALIGLLKIQIVAKNIMAIEEFEQYQNEFNVKWKTDAYWDELLFNEMWETRLAALERFKATGAINTFQSHEWIARNVLQMTEEDIKEERKRIEAERKDPFFDVPEDDKDGTNNGNQWNQ